jgi:hypothetical protein
MSKARERMEDLKARILDKMQSKPFALSERDTAKIFDIAADVIEQFEDIGNVGSCIGTFVHIIARAVVNDDVVPKDDLGRTMHDVMYAAAIGMCAFDKYLLLYFPETQHEELGEVSDYLAGEVELWERIIERMSDKLLAMQSVDRMPESLIKELDDKLRSQLGLDVGKGGE